MTVGVGAPPTEYKLLIDTGSSNTWVGAEQPYVLTSTSNNTGQNFSVTYGSANVSGTEFTDTVTITSSLVISKQSIGVASQSSGLNGLDGILGLGPVDLTIGTLSNTSAAIPTVVDNLFTQGIISSNEFGIFFQPVVSRHETTGEITFGGVDSSRFNGDIGYVPITSTSPASTFWGVDASITYGDSNATVLSQTAGMVDSGTSLILIASDAFQQFLKLTGAALDEATGLLTLSTTHYYNLQSLFFNIGGVEYEFTVNAYTWPRHLNQEIGGHSGAIYLTIADLGTRSGEGLDFILGVPFFERFYVVFDTANQRVGKL